MTLEPECVVWCPKCKADKFTVERMPTRREGIYTHQRRFRGGDLDPNVCGKCHSNLERKPSA